MNKLNKESADKLQNILSKRYGRSLSDNELEIAYKRLMDYAFSILELKNDFKNS